MNRLLFTVILLSICISAAFANDGYVISQQRIIQIYPLYQSWAYDDYDYKFSETSIPMYIYYPVSRVASISIQTNQASVNADSIQNSDGEYLQDINGITDTQFSFNYYLESLNLILNMGVNIPSGKKELTNSEFATSALLSKNFLNMRVPNFGQGLNFSPGMTWAFPLNDNFVLGLGLSYQIKGAFKPREGMDYEYKPGDEILITSGLDIRLTETVSLTGDLIFIMYGKDEIDDVEKLESGKMVIANFQLRKYFDYNELTLMLMYRSKAKNRLNVAGAFMDKPFKTSPNQSGIIAKYRHRFANKIYTTFLMDFKNYEEVYRNPKIHVFGVGIIPEIPLTKNLNMPIRIKYLYGSVKDASNITGIEAGLGLMLWF